MLSRVADSLYWMSRYLERAENTTRQLEVTLALMLDPGGATAEMRWERLTAALGGPSGLEWTGNLDVLAEKVLFDRHNPASVTSCVHCARENARQVREEISTEQWQRLNRLFHQILSPSTQQQFLANSTDVFASILDGLHLFKGVTDTTMLHGPGWQFIRLGRYIERAYATATLVQVFHTDLAAVPDRENSAYRYLDQVGLLRCCTAFEAYCQVYTADISSEKILEFLLLSRSFPHAIRYSIEGMCQAIQAIQQGAGRRSPEELVACVGRLQAMLGYTTITEVLAAGPVAFLHSIRQQCLLIHELIYRHYVQYSIQSALTI